MRYSTPELVVLGSAALLVLGIPTLSGDNGGSAFSHSVAGLALGLDD
jgi:hypothetical protein